MPINQVEPPQAHEILTKHPDAVYLDVRTEPEFAQGHPAGAINVPVVFMKGPGQMELNGEFVDVVAKVLPREKKLVVGCLAGGRSQRACELLRRPATATSPTYAVDLAALATARARWWSRDGVTRGCRS